MGEGLGQSHYVFLKGAALRRPWVMFPIMMVCSCLGMLLIVSSAAAGAGSGKAESLDEARGSALGLGAAGSSQTGMTGAQCARCHEVEGGFSHPVDMVPSMTVPALLPLENGKVTCITCHESTPEAHARNRTAQGAAARAGKLLRGVADEGIFCTQCHVDNGITRKSMHPMGTGKAHLLWVKLPVGAGQLAGPANAPVSTPTALWATPGVSSMSTANDGSRACMGCHDGTVASDALGSGTRGMANGLGGSGDGGHPYGVSYERARVGNQSLKPMGSIDLRVRLFNGQVGCQSCHSPYSTQPKLLVMSNESSRLCSSCHEMR
jgi:predicted CXXCH cytochrome family protein